ncbi:hypothetical protein E0H82_14365 [Acinetobacter sp. ANC 4910]|uniref:hypothetical protein n=1 Tax=Acinetobacter sp. ANC 4910 TaxID=2529850 RepID=UPI00103FA982|nr:hypothetical protein [Acinetobacter sp. ANC 4910]TCB33023.1 hypothetical protein E0H82_14365 [Acinetobacter sp. ANC 4910]
MVFVAGTWLHTEQELVLIEQLKIGDLVLSHHSNGIGKIEYKPVLNILKSDNQYPTMSPIPEVFALKNNPITSR